MSEEKLRRLNQVARELNVSVNTIVDGLSSKGYKVENNPNAKITEDGFQICLGLFASSAQLKKEADEKVIGKKQEPIISLPQITIIEPFEPIKPIENSETLSKVVLPGLKVLNKLDFNKPKVEEKIQLQEQALEVPNQIIQEVIIEQTQIEVPIFEPLVHQVEITQIVEEPVAIPDFFIESVIENTIEFIPETPQIELPNIEFLEPKVDEAVSQIEEVTEDNDVVKGKAEVFKGLTVLGKIQLQAEKPPKPKPEPAPKPSPISNAASEAEKKRKRLRIPTANKPSGSSDQNSQNQGFKKPETSGTQGGYKKPSLPAKPAGKEELTEKEIQDKIKETLSRIGGGSTANNKGFSRAKYRKDKRSAVADASAEKELFEQEQSKILKVTEFISASDLASLMNVSVNQVISVCINLGMFVSINQRLDAEGITFIADEFGYGIEFITAEEEVGINDVNENDSPEDLISRPPVVTIMGHVDHGKTSLLDFIRRSKVTASEAGGITQHIGAYDVVTDDGRKITFLDTPGHEAFTAMRARGAKVTDVVVLVVAADDRVMPQTKEAINHAQVAGVPMVIAINKVDKPGANSDKIREELSAINILVEEWGGKYQCQEVSAKKGTGIAELLEKVLLESEILELKANPNKNAKGTVIEASLDKGRGFVSSMLIQTGSLKVGDILLAGSYFGRVKAMTNHLGQRLKVAGPSMPVQILGLNGAPQAGDKFNVLDTEREARDIATKRSQILREQNIRTKKHITLDEIGRRLAIGNFKELNIIVKGDVDGSVEALSDSLLKLSTEEVRVNIIHKAVGGISESDVLLASASDAIIVAFQVRPSTSARKLAEQEEIEIRQYSVIYAAIDEIKDAMEGLLEPKKVEEITGTIEVREVFKITKIGTVAGCSVSEGFVKRSNYIRLVRDGIVMHTGNIDALKRFKDDVSEVRQGFECGLSIKNFNDIQIGDIIESFEEKEVKRKLQ